MGQGIPTPRPFKIAPSMTDGVIEAGIRGFVLGKKLEAMDEDRKFKLQRSEREAENQRFRIEDREQVNELRGIQTQLAQLNLSKNQLASAISSNKAANTMNRQIMTEYDTRVKQYAASGEANPAWAAENDVQEMYQAATARLKAAGVNLDGAEAPRWTPEIGQRIDRLTRAIAGEAEKLWVTKKDEVTGEMYQENTKTGEKKFNVPRKKEAESPYTKIKPSDYTTESLKKFKESKDYSVLVPRNAPGKKRTLADTKKAIVDKWLKTGPGALTNRERTLVKTEITDPLFKNAMDMVSGDPKAMGLAPEDKVNEVYRVYNELKQRAGGGAGAAGGRTDEDIAFTAQKYGVTVEEVKRQLGIK